MKTWLMILLAMSGAAAIAETATVTVSDAYVRSMPPGRTITAAFFEVSNQGKSACHMVSAESDIAERVELHTHIHEDGLMKMREVPSVELPAGKTVSFKPGGLHIMLYGVKPLKHGDIVQMTLRFKECADLTVDAEVRSIRR